MQGVVFISIADKLASSKAENCGVTKRQNSL
jgi:hypothetical protein